MLIVAGLVLASAAPVAAGGDYCPSGGDCPPPEPPQEDVFQVDADAVICGDPRLWVQYENSGNVDSTAKLVFFKGSQKRFGKVVKKTSLDAGVTKVIGPRWIRGGGAKVVVKAWDPLEQSWALLLKWEQRTFGDAWGTGDCPVNRFGEPTFENPRYTTR
jgi:hypothetical protein